MSYEKPLNLGKVQYNFGQGTWSVSIREFAKETSDHWKEYSRKGYRPNGESFVYNAGFPLRPAVGPTSGGFPALFILLVVSEDGDMKAMQGLLQPVKANGLDWNWVQLGIPMTDVIPYHTVAAWSRATRQSYRVLNRLSR